MHGAFDPEGRLELGNIMAKITRLYMELDENSSRLSTFFLVLSAINFVSRRLSGMFLPLFFFGATETFAIAFHAADGRTEGGLAFFFSLAWTLKNSPPNP